MKNTKGRAIVRACWALAVGIAALAPTASDAALQQATAPTVGGTTARAVYDTDTGLQWLTPQATMWLSYDKVVSSGYLDLGYRFATSHELIGLLSAAGFNVAALPNMEGQVYSTSLPDEAVALRTLIGLLGDTTGRTQPLASNPYSNLIMAGILADISPVDGWMSGGAHYAATLRATEPTVTVAIPGSRFPTSDGNVGSFLVREVSAVPEPAALVMLVGGLLVIAGRVHRLNSRRD